MIGWDDGSSSAGTIAGGVCSGSHVFAQAGVYTVTFAVTDKDGGVGKATSFVVVYDPSAGFVTGGGWINSPAGAYAPDPSMTGKATFGFVSKYQKGQSTPTGNTEFQFETAKFNFSSTSYQWLVVAGAKAQYKGVGMVNGSGGYGFMVTATDGDLIAKGQADRFRMKIWRLDTGALVYDNVPGGSDDIDAANPQALGGGSIVIHK
jgi:hypothetical protein